MSWSENVTILATGIFLVVATLAAIVVAVWRLAMGNPGQRAMGCVSLLLIGGALVVVVAVTLVMLHVGQAGQFWEPVNGPTLSTPYPSFPTAGPSFATPAGGTLP